MKLFAALLIAISLVASASAAIVSSVERLDPGAPAAPGLNTNSNATFRMQVWTDHSFYFRSVPSYLLGAEQILTRYNMDRRDPDFKLKLTLSIPATLYLLIDDKVPSVELEMPWVAALGFVDSGDNAVIEVSRDSVVAIASVYRADFPAGEVVLLQQNDSNPNMTGMYTVGVVPEPASGILLFAGFSALSSRRTIRKRNAKGCIA